MRWRILVSLVVLSLGGFDSVGHAEETSEPPWYFGARFGTGFMLNRLTGVGVSYAETNDRKPPGFDLKMAKVDYSVATSLGAGIDYFIATNIAVGLETKYLASRDHRITTPERSSHVSLDALLISLGARIFLR